MLGEQISDPSGVEGGGALRGMELLPVVTELGEEKVRCQMEGILPKLEGVFASLSGLEYAGYEIHMGKTDFSERGKEIEIRNDALHEKKIELAKYFGLIFVYETSATLPSTFLLPRFLSQEMEKCK